MAFSAYLRPRAPHDLIRVGSAGDGGYVLPKRVIDATRGLLSMGLCDDWSFEADVHRRTGVPVVVFDHSVGPKFWASRLIRSTYRGIVDRSVAKLRRAWRFIDYHRFFDGRARRHIKLAIGRSEHGFVDLAAAMDMAGLHAGILLKVDIEGAEYRIFDQIVTYRDRLVGLAIELHDIDIHEPQIAGFVAGLAPELTLVHFHANNCTTYGPPELSTVIELSFMRSALLEDSEELVARALPIAGLDAKNLPDEADVVVRFA